MAVLPEIHVLRALPVWSPLDRELSDMLLRVTGRSSPVVWFSAALVCSVTRRGDVCVDLDGLAGCRVEDVIRNLGHELQDPEAAQWVLPELSVWKSVLVESGVLGAGHDGAPLRIRGNRLYLSRYFEHEITLARQIAERLQMARPAVSTDLARSLLDRWMQDCSPQARVAAALALARRVSIITGGPGSGKTSTVVRLLGMLSELVQPRGHALRAVLVAPTGKAAARLSEAIERAKQRLLGLPVSEIPTQTSTVHRAIGGCRILQDGSRVPLLADVVVLDEASMIDLARMRQLMQIAEEVERVIILGDAYQLASVEAGAVLGELSSAPSLGFRPGLAHLLEQWTGLAVPTRAVASSNPSVPEPPTVAEHVVELTESHRFRIDGGIGLLARCIKQGDAIGALAVLESGDAELRFVEPSPGATEALLERVAQSNLELWLAPSATLALDLLDRSRVLCAHRKGRFGVEVWNERLARRAHASQMGRTLAGRVEPILLTQNSPESQLRNGDLGIVWRTSDGARAWFASPDGGARPFGLSSVQAYEPAYAMSIHKSQGSEADEVFVILPEPDSPLLTRELLYTAVTRARRRCVVLGSRESIRVAVGRAVARRSGLAQAITEALAERACP